MFSRRAIVLGCLALALVGSSSARARPVPASDGIEAVEVEGTAFRIALASGRVLQGRELTGGTISVALLEDSKPRRIRLAIIT